MFTRKMLALVSALMVAFTLVAGGAFSSPPAKASIGSVPVAALAAASNHVAAAQASDKPAAQAGAPKRPQSHDPYQRMRQRLHQPNIDDPNAPNDPTLQDPTQRLIPPVGASNPLTSSWAQVPAPTAGPVDAYLWGVKLLGSNDGWAVGYYGSSATLIERWDGSSWSVVPSPNSDPYYDGLYSVDIVSANEAYAVGYGSNNTLIERWDGNAWSIVPFSTPGTLLSVKVVSASDIWAVGSNYANGASQPLTVHYDGTSWSVVTAPGPPSGTSYYLQGVDASAGNDVWAVGYSYNTTNYYDTALIMHWNGTIWTIVPAPITGAINSDLYSVVSVSAYSAWAVGAYEDSAYQGHTLILHWNGSTWVQQTGGPGGGAFSSYLSGVTAVSGSELWAVGYNSGVPYRLHTTDAGATWNQVAGPSTVSGFNAVAATSSNNVVAVGCSSYTGCSHTRVERWDGSVWTLQSSSPTFGQLSAFFKSAAAVDPTHAWAVGNYSDGNPFIFSWDGGSWIAISSTLLPAGGVFASMYDISASAANNVWAVGDYQTGDYTGHNLTLHFDGSAWHIVPLAFYSFRSVSTVAPNDVWAMDSYSIYHYDGNTWTAVSYPQPPSRAYLSMIRARTANDVWAVGHYYDSNNVATTVTFHYTNGTWTLVPAAPVTGDTYAYARAIQPVSATEAWLGGYYRLATGSLRTLLQHWDGTTNTWTQIDTSGLPYTRIVSMSANSASSVWAAGGNILHWDGTTWTPSDANALAVASYGDTVTWGFSNMGQNFSYVPVIYIHPALGPGEFYDVPPGSLWYTFVTWLAQHGVVNGISYGYYSPNANTTRAQFTKMIVAGFGYQLINPPTPYFSDVPTNYWAYQYIETAHAHNVIGGYSQAQCAAIGHAYPCFGPNDNITRAQIVIIVVNAKGWTLNTPGTPTFSDVPANSFAYAAVETAVSHGVISGFVDNGSYHPCADAGVGSPCFRPNNNGTRGQLAKILYLTLNAPGGTPTPTVSNTTTPLPPTDTPIATSTTVPLTNTPMVTDTPLPTVTPTP